MSQLYIFLPDGSMLQREEPALAADIAQSINNGHWQQYVPSSVADKSVWKATQIDRRVLVYIPIPEVDFKVPKLKPRQTQILQLLLSGKTIIQIAWELHIGKRTVAGHLNRLKTTFNANSLSQLIAYAVKSGAVEVLPPEN